MDELIERLERLTGPDYKIDGEIAKSQGWRYSMRELTGLWGWTRPNMPDHYNASPPVYTASIDAAMTLVPERYAVNSIRETTETEQDEHTGDEPLPLWSVALVRRDCTGYQNRKKFVVAFQYGSASTPAIALCIAALRARNPQ